MSMQHERAVRELFLADAERLRPTVGAAYDAAQRRARSRRRWSLAAYCRLLGIVPAWIGEADRVWKHGYAVLSDTAAFSDLMGRQVAKNTDRRSTKGQVADVWPDDDDRHVVKTVRGLRDELAAEDAEVPRFVKAGDCELWIGAKRRGYPQLRAGAKTISPHRWRFERHKGGPIAPRMALVQTCGNRGCVAIEHLREFPKVNNLRPAASLARFPRGALYEPVPGRLRFVHRARVTTHFVPKLPVQRPMGGGPETVLAPALGRRDGGPERTAPVR